MAQLKDGSIIKKGAGDEPIVSMQDVTPNSGDILIWNAISLRWDPEPQHGMLYFSIFGSGASVSVGDGTAGFSIPAALNGLNLTSAIASVFDKGVTGTTDIQIRRRRAGANADMLSTKITIGDEYFAADSVIDATNDDALTGDMIFVDIDAIHSGTAPKGLSVTLGFGEA